jgi:hypothetical protein
MRIKRITNTMRRITLKQLEESRHISDCNIIWDITGVVGVAEK